jgi:YbbR domain-containing protein
MTQRTRPSVTNNLWWLLASFALAFVVWLVATIQSDPIMQQSYNNVPIQVIVPDGFVLTENPRTTARVIVRGQESALSLLTVDDIVLKADLTNRTGGAQTVALIPTINRQGTFTIDTQPTQLTMTMEQVQTVQKPISVLVTNAPPVDYAYDAPVTDVLQAEVRGASSKVAEVVSLKAELDLDNQRNPYETDLALVPIDVDGQRVLDVTVEPRNTHINVNIYARDDVRQVSVRPNIRLSTLESGYVLTSISYEPQVVYLSGNVGDLASIGATIDTESISLSGQTENLTIQVGLELPNNLIVLNDRNIITVTLGISAQNSVRQIDNIPIEIIGLGEGSTAVITPNTLSVVLTGPITTLETITVSDIKAIVDLNNVPFGNSEVSPRIVIRQGEITLDTTPLPAVISVNITPPTPEATPEATP